MSLWRSFENEIYHGSVMLGSGEFRAIKKEIPNIVISGNINNNDSELVRLARKATTGSEWRV